MNDIGVTTEFFAIQEESEQSPDGDRLFTLTRRKTLENITTGSKPRLQRFKHLSAQDLDDLKKTCAATLQLLEIRGELR
jgi:hypothetical protein